VPLALAGVWLRAHELGTWSLSNDEAWVALCTRVEGVRQFWLAIASTPLAWALLLKIDALAVEATETTLRAVPFAFGGLTMWVAYRAGERFAGHRLGGVLALAVVAFDPLSIWYAKFLKQYTAEAFFCVLAVDRAAVFAERRERRDLLAVAAVLALGLPFANAQLFVAPAVLGALLVDTMWRRDGRTLRAVLLTTAAVGAWAVVYHALALAPRLRVAGVYWARQVYLPASVEGMHLLWRRLSSMLAPTLGEWGTVVAASSLAVASMAPRRRVVCVALLLLVAEVAVLSMLRRVPVNQPRVLLFLTTALAVYGAAAVGFVVARAWTRPVLGTAATLGLAFLGYEAVQAHRARVPARPAVVDDAESFVRLAQDERHADPLLLHGKARYVFAYYDRARPVLDRLPSVAIGWVPRTADPSILTVNERALQATAKQLLVAHPRVWFLALGQRSDVEDRLRAVLARVGTITHTSRRRGALLVTVTRGESAGTGSP